MPRQESKEADAPEAKRGLMSGRTLVAQALTSFGEGNAEIVGTDAVGAVAGQQLRNQAVAVTLLALVGMLLFIAFRFEWTYGAAAVIAVFHTVLVTLGMFSIFQWEFNLTVIAGLLTLVGFSVNDSIVVFDRIRENLKLHRRTTFMTLRTCRSTRRSRARLSQPDWYSSRWLRWCCSAVQRCAPFHSRCCSASSSALTRPSPSPAQSWSGGSSS